jgi:hypothetical protein
MSPKESLLQEKFILLLKEKIPQNLLKTLMDLLPLEKEAIYRRLRGDVAFSFFEIATICTYLNIPMNDIVEILSPFDISWHCLYFRDYSLYKNEDLGMSAEYISVLLRAAEDSNSEFGMAVNMFPLHISLLHYPIYRIYLLKWLKLFGKIPRNGLTYEDTQIPEKEKEHHRKGLECFKQIRHTFIILDRFIFTSLINDINFFYNIRMISKEDMKMLYHEILSLINTLEHYADFGYYDTGNKIEIYVSDLAFDCSYSYLLSEKEVLSVSSSYVLAGFVSVKRKFCNEMKDWIHSLKKSSTLISGAGQYAKIVFFEQQRELLKKNLLYGIEL